MVRYLFECNKTTGCPYKSPILYIRDLRETKCNEALVEKAQEKVSGSLPTPRDEDDCEKTFRTTKNKLAKALPSIERVQSPRVGIHRPGSTESTAMAIDDSSSECTSGFPQLSVAKLGGGERRQRSIFEHCDARGSRPVKGHYNSAHVDTGETCSQCDDGKVYSNKSAIRKHKRRFHSDDEATRCSFPGCKSTAFYTTVKLEHHLQRAHSLRSKADRAPYQPDHEELNIARFGKAVPALVGKVKRGLGAKSSRLEYFEQQMTQFTKRQHRPLQIAFDQQIMLPVEFRPDICLNHQHRVMQFTNDGFWVAEWCLPTKDSRIA